jgi:hypothetical protein
MEATTMGTYFCAGYVRLASDKLGVKYLPVIDNGKVDNNLAVSEDSDKKLMFKRDKQVDYPVGWLVEIEEFDGHFRGFKVLDHSCDQFPEMIDKYKMLSLVAKKEMDLERLRKRGLEISVTLGNMTLKELKEYYHDHPLAREAIKFYLFETF